MAETKGSNILAAYDVLTERIGKARMDAIVDGLPQDLREPLATQSLSRLTWYPASLYAEFLAAVERGCPDKPTLLRDAGHEVVQRDLRGVYKILVKVISPGMLVSWGPRTFGQYYRGGTLTVKVVSKDNAADAQYTGWDGFNGAIWQTVAGGVQAAIVACGGHAPRASYVAGGVGPDAAMHLIWQMQ